MNIILDSFFRKNLNALAVSILSNQDTTFFMSVKGTTTTGIQEGIKIAYFTLFLEFNSNAFFFRKSIT